MRLAITVTLILTAAAAPVLAQPIGNTTYANIDAANRINSKDPTAAGANSNGDGKNFRLSSEVDRLLRQAQQDIDTKKWVDAVQAVQTAQKSVQGNYDRLKVYQYLTTVNLGLDNTQDAAAAAEQAAAVPDIPEADRVDVYAQAAALAFNVGDRDKAVQYANELKALNPKDDDSKHIIAIILPVQNTAQK